MYRAESGKDYIFAATLRKRAPDRSSQADFGPKFSSRTSICHPFATVGAGCGQKSYPVAQRSVNLARQSERCIG